MARKSRDTESPNVGDLFVVRGREYEVESVDDEFVNLVRPDGETAPKKAPSAPVASWQEPWPSTMQGRLDAVEYDADDEVYFFTGTKDSKANRGGTAVAAVAEVEAHDVSESSPRRRPAAKKKKAYRR